MTTTLPGWLAEAAAEGFPTSPVSDERVGVAARVPVDWRHLEREEPDGQRGAQWSGRPGEGLRVVRLAGADPAADIAGWLELPMAAVGGLDPQTLTAHLPCRVLAWQELPAGGLTDLWDLDDCRAYDGTAVLDTGDGSDLVHQYVVLARRGDVAWKVALTLASAVLPGAEEDHVARNDHVRAAACLADLRLG